MAISVEPSLEPSSTMINSHEWAEASIASAMRSISAWRCPASLWTGNTIETSTGNSVEMSSSSDDAGTAKAYVTPLRAQGLLPMGSPMKRVLASLVGMTVVASGFVAAPSGASDVFSGDQLWNQQWEILMVGTAVRLR